jgi:very-short-patch-repair endonuclease
MSDGELKIACSVAENVNVAFYQNAVPFVRELTLENEVGRDLAEVAVRLSSEPAFLTPGVWRIDRIADKTTHHVRGLDLKLDPVFLAGLTASRRAEIHIVAEAGGITLSEYKFDVNLLPPSHWGGVGSAPELLAAFVRPTDPSVDVILREAAEKLAQAGRDPAVDGYKKGKKTRAWEIAEAIWAALVGHSIAYVLPPKSFEREGQQVRGPSDILSRQVGTCLDLSLFYASCLEQAGLNPLVVLTDGHAFAGVWLVDEDFAASIVDDAQMLRKRVQLQEMILVETTMLAGAQPARFKQAVEQGAKQIAEDAVVLLELAVDIRRARAARIKPLDLGGGGGPVIEPKTFAAKAHILDEAPKFEEEMDRRPQSEERPLDRLESWKRSLLDLTLRNRLLNFKDSKATIAIECPDPAKLEDMLAAGHPFKLLGRTTVLDGSDGRDPALFTERQNEDGRKLYVLDAMARGELHANVAEADLEGRLTDLYRASRLAFEEGGANILYLCLGFLKWTPIDGAGSYRAPLILVPVSLERKSVRSGFRLKLHEDDARFNPTLLQMLRQDFELSAPKLDGELPRDGSGIDVAEVWRIVQRHVKAIKGWEVAEQVVLATLSFTKYLMWKDLVDRTDDLKRNPIVRHLIDTPTHTYEGSSGDFIDPASLDDAVDPAELFAPLSGDSSQLAAVVAAQRGKDFVLFGPPGAGKSQTIANMISNCLAHGKSVLFVSQKTAALEVVRRRLHNIGLGGYCLEVHSTKAQKSSVIEQLATAWRERGGADEESWAAANAELKTKRDELNRLVSALHRRRGNGMTAYEAFGRVVADRGSLPDVGLSWQTGVDHNPQTLSALRAACSDLGTAMLAVGDPSKHPLRGIEQTKWTPAWAQEAQALIDSLQAAVLQLRAVTEAFVVSIGLGQQTRGLAELLELQTLGALLTRPEAAEGAFGALLLADESSDRLHRALHDLKEVVNRARAATRELNAEYAPEAARLDLAQLQRDWAEACAANFLFREGKKSKLRLLLKPYCKGEPPQEIGRDLVGLQRLAGIMAEAERLKPAFAGLERLWRGVDTDIPRLDRMMALAKDTREAIRAFGTETDDAAWLREHVTLLLTDYPHLFAPGGAARKDFEAVQEGWAATWAAIVKLGCCVELDDPQRLLEPRPDWDEDLIQRTSRWKANILKAPEWAKWRAAAIAGKNAGLGSLIEAIEAGAVTTKTIQPIFEFSYARWFAEKIVNEDEVLSSFLAVQHEAVIEAFVAADQRVSELSKQIVRARLGGSIPSQTNFGADPEWGTLARETKKKAQHMPLRQLFGRIPTVLTRLTPCVMMSPLSIAQYLPPDARPFDVVIFDEASQIQVWDAIGAIARGNQAIIVGDPEQLPPTAVGERAADGDGDDDGAVLPSQQSILDECLASNIPNMQLKWHYRSRYESLIAFSNAKYYRGELITFPSPVTRDDAVRYVHVEGGVYERGASKTNRKEARAVVDEVVRRLKTSPHSIGVVTFNGEQQRLIENLLDQERRSDPSLERFFDRSQTTEPILVKNIENVQGDERDVIIFSIAVGPDKDGRVTAQISSLNGAGGHRRLNVAVTRARRELLVFATLRPEQIDLGRTNAKGVVDFKHFLEFAQNGARAIAESFAPTGRETESPFEAAVKRALEAKGWEVHPQIGVSFFRIDLGVVHPDHPGRYLAGVECDGASYHRSATARDRDRLREWVLTDLGWTIRRIWSTEWWMDAASALDKLHARLEADLEADRAKQVQLQAPEPADAEIPSSVEPERDDRGSDDASRLEEEPSFPRPANDAEPVAEAKIYARKPEIATASPLYVVADPATIATPDQARFYDRDYRLVLREMVDHVVEIEGPIYFDVLVDRISRAHGFQRAADKIRGIIKATLRRDRMPVTKDGDREIVWPPDTDTRALAPYRRGERRDHGDIPLPELASLAAKLRETGFEGEELVREMQEHFRLARLAASTRERFEAAVTLALGTDRPG